MEMNANRQGGIPGISADRGSGTLRRNDFAPPPAEISSGWTNSTSAVSDNSILLNPITPISALCGQRWFVHYCDGNRRWRKHFVVLRVFASGHPACDNKRGHRWKELISYRHEFYQRAVLTSGWG